MSSKTATDSPGFARLKAHPDYPNMVKRTLAEQARAISEVGHPKTKARPVTRKDYPVTKGR